MRRPTTADVAVIVGAVAAVALSYRMFWGAGGAAEYALVHRGGETVARHALDGERTVSVPGRLGPSVLEIAPGRIRFTASPCRGKLCVHAGWQTTAGAVAACLPNGLSVEVVGAARVYDSINF